MSRSWRFVLFGLAIAGAALLFFLSRSGMPAAQTVRPVPATRTEDTRAVGCAGRVAPEDGITVVAAGPESGSAPVISRLFVHEGQSIAAGQIIATLQALPDLEAAVRQAEARLNVAQSRAAQLQAGARPGDVMAMKADLARMESESKAAREELARKEALAAKDYVPRVQVDAARLKAEDADRSLEAARHRLESLTEVRESDLNLAKAEVTAAQADLDRARIRQKAGAIIAPRKGRVVRVIARPGEAVGPDGVITLADTTRMEVIAEVYETDVARVHAGEKARISADWLPEALEGVVRSVSPQIASRSVPVDPSAAADQRVYQTRIQIARPELLADRINSKVNVVIEP